MQPNFAVMTNKALIDYALAHRDEIEPLRVLYDRRTPDDQTTIYPAPCTSEGVPIEENIKIMEEAIRQRIDRDRNKI
ncbi:MAG: hypothetical protein AAGA60_05495 [Cyanobacteria bacterium P01_E01_bin.42]